jgi:hypothetical protein
MFSGVSTDNPAHATRPLRSNKSNKIRFSLGVALALARLSLTFDYS